MTALFHIWHWRPAINSFTKSKYHKWGQILDCIQAAIDLALVVLSMQCKAGSVSSENTCLYEPILSANIKINTGTQKLSTSYFIIVINLFFVFMIVY
jgi:hypothetical protein